MVKEASESLVVLQLIQEISTQVTFIIPYFMSSIFINCCLFVAPVGYPLPRER